MPTHPTSRRTFLKAVGATSIVAATVGVGGVGTAAAAAPATVSPVGALPTMFRIDYPEDVVVKVTSGRRFELIVADRDGNVLEHHRWLTMRRLFRLQSNRFAVSPVSPESVTITE